MGKSGTVDNVSSWGPSDDPSPLLEMTSAFWGADHLLLFAVCTAAGMTP